MSDYWDSLRPVAPSETMDPYDVCCEEREELLSLVRAVRPYIELEASLQNSGQGNVIGNPAKKLLSRIDEVLR